MESAVNAVTTVRFTASPKKFDVSCSGCNVNDLCLTQGMHVDDMRRFENVVYHVTYPRLLRAAVTTVRDRRR